MKIRTLILSLVALCAFVPALSAQSFRAGAAKVDITPKTSDLANKTDIIRDQLFVRAIYMERGDTKAILATADQGGIHGFDDVISKVSAATGVPVDNIIISATHTHSGNTNGFSGAPSTDQVKDAFYKAATEAKTKAAPARLGYGPNWKGDADKTLSVLTFMGEDDVPIAVYMNYAMHPVNFFLRGVISADYPGDATKYIEDLFDGKTVALFSQGTSGNANPQFAYSSIFQEGQVKGVLPPSDIKGKNPMQPGAVPADRLAAHQKVVERVSDYVHTLGVMVGVSAMKAMLYNTHYESDPVIWAGTQTLTFPGRNRIDTKGRENYNPGYTDGPDVQFTVGLLRLGTVNMVTVSGEVYSEIGARLKEESPYANTFMVTLRNGMSPGYIYSNAASNNLTFQVIGSRIKPGYVEKGIVDTSLKLMEQANR